MFTREQEIEEFLDEYRRSRVIIETTVRATLNKFIEFEDKFRKPFYEFSEEEALKVFKSSHTISIVALQNSNLLLKHISRWIIDKKKLNDPEIQDFLLGDKKSSIMPSELQHEVVEAIMIDKLQILSLGGAILEQSNVNIKKVDAKVENAKN